MALSTEKVHTSTPIKIAILVGGHSVRNMAMAPILTIKQAQS
jgi:hypothetical protein